MVVFQNNFAISIFFLSDAKNFKEHPHMIGILRVFV